MFPRWQLQENIAFMAIRNRDVSRDIIILGARERDSPDIKRHVPAYN